jgi:hypothetical protein
MGKSMGKWGKIKFLHNSKDPAYCERKNMANMKKNIRGLKIIYFPLSDRFYRVRTRYRIFPGPISGIWPRIRIPRVEKPIMCFYFTILTAFKRNKKVWKSRYSNRPRPPSSQTKRTRNTPRRKTTFNKFWKKKNFFTPPRAVSNLSALHLSDSDEWYTVRTARLWGVWKIKNFWIFPKIQFFTNFWVN